jgi:hypothetical protein
LGTLLVAFGTAGIAVPVKVSWQLAAYLQTGDLYVDGSQLVAQVLQTIPMFLLFYYGAQVPFWILRYTSGMRITRDPDFAPSTNRGLRVLDLFGVLAFVGIVMAIGRVAAPESDAWIFVGIIAMVIGGMWVIGVLLLLAALGTRRPLKGAAIVVGLCELCAISAVLVNRYVDQQLSPEIIVAAFHGMALSIVMLTLGNSAAARACGYRLIWTRLWPAPARVAVHAVSSRPTTSPSLPEP